MATGIHLDLDSAWGSAPLGLPVCDARAWGPRLRFIAPRRAVEDFARQIVVGLPPLVLYGSGDFHHLSALLLRRIAEPVTVISFDNHPDWDRRPPRWGCGGWINRALELPHVQRVAVWGCGNFELNASGRLFGQMPAVKTGRVQIFPWSERYPPATCRFFNAIARPAWREEFMRFADGLAGKAVYVTVDMDCLAEAEAVTNWENGLFTAADLAWAIGQLASYARLAGADVCGAWSAPAYATWWQRLAGRWDHPRQVPADAEAAARINSASLQILWPALVAACSQTRS